MVYPANLERMSMPVRKLECQRCMEAASLII